MSSRWLSSLPKWLFWGILSLIILIALFLLIYLNKPRLTNQSNPIIYVYKPGATVQRLAYDLKKLRIIDHPNLLINIILLEGREGVLQSGAYEFTPGMSLQTFIDNLAQGNIATFRFTIVDGWTFNQMRRALDNNPYIEHETKDLSDRKIMEKIGLPYPHIEGLFLPETYEFYWKESDLNILKRASQALQIILNSEWQLRTTGDFYSSPYQALIVASMIEKETNKPTEYKKVSGVIYRRLQQHMRLQIDPTVIYGLGTRYQGKLTHADLWIDTPYNTYRHKGLPPTPISLPSAATIQAALQPDDGSEIYFVATGDGGHYFSDNLVEHNAAVQKYLLKSKPKDRIPPTI